MSVQRSSLDTFDEMMRGNPQTGGAAGAGRPQLPKTERQAKADATSDVARSLIDAATDARAAKTERLKAQREERNARDQAAE